MFALGFMFGSVMTLMILFLILIVGERAIDREERCDHNHDNHDRV